MKYRKKPVVVEAMQWFPPGDDRHDPSMLSRRKGSSVYPPDYRQEGDLYRYSPIRDGWYEMFFIKTTNGSIRTSPGDWIITRIDGKKYPCKPDIFEATYDIVSE